VFLSVVVVTGYAGQISLGQFGVAGCAALLAGIFSGQVGLPLPLVMLLVIIIVLPVGIVLGIPAFRARGMSLAIATLGLAEVVNDAILSNPSVTNGSAGVTTRSPELFGYSINPIMHPNRYAIFAFLVFTIGALVTLAFRRSHIARRWLAVRANERAAASLGVSVITSKASALCLGAALAGAGGVLFAFSGPIVSFTGYGSDASIDAVVLTMIGGIGFLAGAFNGALIASGGLLTLAVSQYLGWSYGAIGLLSGILVIINVITAPSGAAYNVQLLLQRLRRKAPAAAPTFAVRDDDERPSHAPASDKLSVECVSIRFGGIQALDNVSLTVSSSQIVGLIGPNGAGKTTLVDAISGFSGGYSGVIALNGAQLNRKAPTMRARMGLSRAFQSIEMFEDLSLYDNLRVGAEVCIRVWARPGPRMLAGRRQLALPPACADAVEQFGLAGHLGGLPSELSYGQRRLASIARALASDPKFILLDEPAAGLGQGDRVVLESFLRRLADSYHLGVLLIEHDVPLVLAVCDSIVALDFGKVVATGPPEVIRRDPRVVESYIGRADDSAAIAAAGER
jgi:sulfate-transporting ATPase